MNYSGSISLQSLHIPISKVFIKKPILVKWVLPPEDSLKLNIDGASKGISGNAGCGGIIRTANNSVVVAFSSFLGQGTNDMAEFHALKTGLDICYQLSIEHILVESDSILLVKCFAGIQKPPWPLLPIWNAIQELTSWISISVSHIYREGNQVADFFAKSGADGNNEYYESAKDFPPKALNLWSLDCMGMPNWRHFN